MLTFHVGSLINKPQGTRERFKVDEHFAFEEKDGPVLRENVVAQVQFLKLPHEINVQLHDLHTVVECICSRCLKTFLHTITVPFTEREFVIDLPSRDLEPGEDIYYVNDNEILIDEMVRQEILLHFPQFPLCSESCKGLCDQCGIDLNESRCAHKN